MLTLGLGSFRLLVLTLAVTSRTLTTLRALAITLKRYTSDAVYSTLLAHVGTKSVPWFCEFCMPRKLGLRELALSVWAEARSWVMLRGAEHEEAGPQRFLLVQLSLTVVIACHRRPTEADWGKSRLSARERSRASLEHRRGGSRKEFHRPASGIEW